MKLQLEIKVFVCQAVKDSELHCKSLYNKPDVLVLDEAQSASDDETETGSYGCCKQSQEEN